MLLIPILLCVAVGLTITALSMYVCFLKEQLQESEYKNFQIRSCIEEGKLIYASSILDMVESTHGKSA